MVGCVIRVADIVYPLSAEPDWRGFAWVANPQVGICVVDYLNKALRRSDNVVFSCVVPLDGAYWVIAEEQAEEVEWAVMLMDAHLTEDFYKELSPREIAEQPDNDVRFHLMAIRAAIRYESIHPDDLLILVDRALEDSGEEASTNFDSEDSEEVSKPEPASQVLEQPADLPQNAEQSGAKVSQTPETKVVTAEYRDTTWISRATSGSLNPGLIQKMIEREVLRSSIFQNGRWYIHLGELGTCRPAFAEVLREAKEENHDFAKPRKPKKKPST